MKPRYKVIADYPGSEFKVGAIMIFIEKFMHRTDGTAKSIRYSDVFKSGNAIIMVSGPNAIHQYPHLFKPLAWWEEREVGDMPGYIECAVECRIPKGTILKANWESYTTSNDIAHRGKNPDFWIDAKYFLPATESEYLTQSPAKAGGVK